VIVREEGAEVVIVRQADHAELSGRLAAAWGRDPWQPAEPYPSVVVGARRHDDAWLVFDEAPEVTEDRRPLSFFEVDRVRTSDMYRRGVEALYAIDAYAALLVSLHFSGFFHSHWGWQPFSLPENFTGPQAVALRDFVDGELDRQDRLRAELDLDEAGETQLAANYKWLQLWDRISLDICRQDALQPWAVEYPATPLTADIGAEDGSLKFSMIAPGEYRLAPYPLRLEALKVVIPATRLLPADYATREQFLDAWRRAAPWYIHANIAPA
jgi:hypothetical protein